MSKFGNKIKDLRTERNLKPGKVAYDVGIPESRLNELEWGVRIPTAGQIERLEKYFEVTEGELAALMEE